MQLSARQSLTGAIASKTPTALPIALVVIRGSLEPFAGIVFAGLWLTNDIGRDNAAVVIACLVGLAIAVSRFTPRIAMGIIALMLIAQAVRVIPLPGANDWAAYFGIAIVVGIVASGRNARVRWIALGFGAVAAVAAVALMVFQGGGYTGWLNWIGWGHIRTPDVLGQFADLVGAGVVTSCLAWGSGFAISATRRLIQSQQVAAGATRLLAKSEVELAVAQERNRIAQEMHDVLAHSLAVVVAQADGARYLRPSRPAAVDGALQAIADSARLALGDMRGLIDGILDGSELPQPRLADLRPLVAGTASTGMKVVFRETGDRGELGVGQELALYRIVQEGLTNALRHRGRGCEVRIVLDWRGPGVSVLLESTGGDVIAGDVALTDGSNLTRSGRGVIGMRERAHVAGGWLTVGLEDDGTHRLTAFLPYYSNRDSTRGRIAELSP